MRLIKESKIKRAVINPGNYRRRTGCGYHLFVNTHRLCFGRGLAPRPRHLAGTNRQRHFLGARMSDVTKWQRDCERRDLQVLPPLCHRHQCHGAGVRHRRSGGDGRADTFGRTELLNTAREEKWEENGDGGRINSVIPVTNVRIGPVR